mgnify:CR=1 FL=1
MWFLSRWPTHVLNKCWLLVKSFVFLHEYHHLTYDLRSTWAYKVFPLLLLRLLHFCTSLQRVESCGVRPLYAFFHSSTLSTTIVMMMVALFNRSLCLCLSLSLSPSLFLFLSSMRAKHMHTLHTQIRTKETSYGLENEKQRSRRRSCSYQFTASRLDARKKLSV